jgi:hypothetical protein
LDADQGAPELLLLLNFGCWNVVVGNYVRLSANFFDGSSLAVARLVSRISIIRV